VGSRLRFSTVVFDLDGTLLDTLDDITSALNHALAQAGLGERTRDEVRSYLGRGFRRLVACALPGGENDPAYRDVLAGFGSYYTEHCQVQTAPYPGVLDVLRHLSERGVRLAIASNKGDEAVKRLATHHFSGLIEPAHAFGQRDDLPRKPAPDLVFLALASLGETVDHALYVGDSDVDYATARAAGMPCCLVSWGFKERSLLETLDAEFLVDDASGLERVCLG
jgi:phosphoglycolate phosphatase